jgi:hypothetical protein
MLNRKRQNERLQIGEQKGKYGEYCQSSELGFLGCVRTGIQDASKYS